MHRFRVRCIDWIRRMDATLISIGGASRLLGISIDTLRRWDTSGRLHSVRSGPKGHRFYQLSEIEQLTQNQYRRAREWVESPGGFEVSPDVFCHTRDIFQARLEKLQAKLSRNFPIEIVSLSIDVAGEIGNNSFDHNLGNWPDITGIFFTYHTTSKTIILADRGVGVLATLKRVKPELTTASDALRVAFTETISGRMPEARGNGLKFVRSVIIHNPFLLYFQTGDAYLYLKKNDRDITIQHADRIIRGCFATIKIEDIV